MKEKRNKLKDITFGEVKKLINNGAKITFIDQMKDKKSLNTKYLKILTTEPQRSIIKRAINKVMKQEQVKEGRATELIAADFLSSYEK